jgi:hypothetical protein
MAEAAMLNVRLGKHRDDKAWGMGDVFTVPQRAVGCGIVDASELSFLVVS